MNSIHKKTSKLISIIRKKSKLSKRKLKQGFTLLELMIVLVILGALMTIFIVVVDPGDDEAQRNMHNKAAYAQISAALMKFKVTCGRLPTNSEGVAVLHKKGPAPENCAHKNYILNRKMLKDYYQNYYVFEIDDNGDYKILSLGADKTKGGEGKNADVDLRNMD